MTLTVTAERSALLTVSSGGQVLHQARAMGETQTLAFTAPDGIHDLLVTATDAAGNASPQASSKISIDTVAPPPPVLAIEPAGAGRPDTRVRVEGEAGSMARVRALRLDGTPAGDWTERSLSAGSATVGLRLPNGSYTVQSLVVDPAGNSSGMTAAPAEVVIAKPRAPEVRLRSAKGASPVRIEVSGDPHTTAAVAIIGPEETIERSVLLGPKGQGMLSIPLEDGSYDAEVVLVDFQEQASGASKLAAFLVKSTPPDLDVVPIEEAMDGGRIAVALRAEKGTDVRVSTVDGSVDQTITGTGGIQKVVIPARAGTHALQFVATDAYGNRSKLNQEVLVSEELGAGGTAVLLGVLGGAGWGGRALWRRRRARRAAKGVPAGA